MYVCVLVCVYMNDMFQQTESMKLRAYVYVYICGAYVYVPHGRQIKSQGTQLHSKTLQHIHTYIHTYNSSNTSPESICSAWQANQKPRLTTTPLQRPPPRSRKRTSLAAISPSSHKPRDVHMHKQLQ